MLIRPCPFLRRFIMENIYIFIITEILSKKWLKQKLGTEYSIENFNYYKTTKINVILI